VSNKKILIYGFLAIIFVLLAILSGYNNIPRSSTSEVSGIFIDSKSAEDGVTLNYCFLDSMDEINQDRPSEFVLGCNFSNYRPPVYVEIYFPFEFEISSFGRNRALLNVETGEYSNISSYSYDAKVIDGKKLQIVYNDSEVPDEQIKITSKIFESELPSKQVLKIFQINENPLPYSSSGKYRFQNNNIIYSLRIPRNTYNIGDDSNFIPTVRNEITGNYDYQRLILNPIEMPGEAILYLEDIEKTNLKNLINSISTLFAGVILGLILSGALKYFMKE